MAVNVATRALVLSEVLIRRTRTLPCDGQVAVKLGDLVRPDDVVARAKQPAEPVVLMVGRAVGVPSKDLGRRLRRWAGEAVEKGEILAEKRGIFGLGRRVCRSPIDGTVISGPHADGEVVISPPDVELELRAALTGRVVGVIPYRGVAIETLATYIQGIGGYGGETAGRIELGADSPDREIDATSITADSAGAVLAGGSVRAEALRRAAEMKVAAIIVGGIGGEAYHWLLKERPDVTVVITEGSGARAMAADTFQLLRQNVSQRALVDGRPSAEAAAEVIISRPGSLKAPGVPPVSLAIGAAARIVGGNSAGRRGWIRALPAVPRRLPSGVVSAVAEVELEDGQVVAVACTNLRLIG